MPLDLTQLSQITEPLLAWYEKNARVLPWRENTDAYRVWVSEITIAYSSTGCSTLITSGNSA